MKKVNVKKFVESYLKEDGKDTRFKGDVYLDDGDFQLVVDVKSLEDFKYNCNLLYKDGLKFFDAAVHKYEKGEGYTKAFCAATNDLPEDDIQEIKNNGVGEEPYYIENGLIGHALYDPDTENWRCCIYYPQI